MSRTQLDIPPPTDNPATLPLRSTLTQPAIRESDAFKHRMDQELSSVLSQITLVDAEITALNTRRNDLLRIESAARQAILKLEEGEQIQFPRGRPTNVNAH
jgi:hypothetical protein